MSQSVTQQQQTGGPGGYIRRKINYTIQLGEGDFGNGGFKNVSLKGLRSSAQIQKQGLPTANTAQVHVFGVPYSLMNKVSTIGTFNNQMRNNVLTISAGDPESGVGIVFVGVIQEAWADFDGMPEVGFVMMAQTAALDQLKPVNPNGYGATADVVTIMSSLATQAGYQFENNGVSGITLSYPYFPGTITDQIAACARAAHIAYIVDDSGRDGAVTLAIWPMNGNRTGKIPLVSPGAGLVGYPSYSGPGFVRFRTVFNPNIRFGGQIKVEHTSPPTNGIWTVSGIEHNLEAEVPGGAWFTDIIANRGPDAGIKS